MIYVGIFDNIKGDNLSVTIYTGNDKYSLQPSAGRSWYVLYEASKITNPEYDMEECNRDWSENFNPSGWYLVDMAESPATITMNGNTDDVFCPIHTYSANVSIISEKPYLDMYSSDLSTEIVIKNETLNKVLFFGYITPNVYSQPFDDHLNQIDLECVSPIGILKYYNMEDITDIQNLGYVKLDELIFEYILYGSKDYYKDFYVQKSIYAHANNTFYYNVFDRLMVYPKAFIDKNDVNKGWTYYEILEEVCRSLCLQLYEFDNKFYFLDVANLNDWASDDSLSIPFYHFTLDEYDIPQSEEVSLPISYITMNTNNTAGNTDISIDNSYNKISVIANTYPISDLKQNWYDGAQIYKYNNFAQTELRNSWSQKITGSEYIIPGSTTPSAWLIYGNGGNLDLNSHLSDGYVKWTDWYRNSDNVHKVSSENYILSATYESAPRITRTWFSGDSGGTYSTNTISKPSNWDNLISLFAMGTCILNPDYGFNDTRAIGCHLIRETTKLQTGDSLNNWHICLDAYGTFKMRTSAFNSPEGSISYIPMYVIYPNQKVCTYKYINLFPNNIANNLWLNINFSTTHIGSNDGGWIMPACSPHQIKNYNGGQLNADPRFNCISMEVRVGDWYLVGMTAVTTGTDSITGQTVSYQEYAKYADSMWTAKDYGYVYGNGNYQYKWVKLGSTGITNFMNWNNGLRPIVRLYGADTSSYLNTSKDIATNVKNYMNLQSNVKGAVFALPTDISIYNDIFISFYRPGYVNINEKCSYVLISNLDVHIEQEVERSSDYEFDDDANEQDTKYTNIEEESYCIEMDDVEIKLNQQNPDKQPSLSSYLVTTNGVIHFLDGLYSIEKEQTFRLENLIIQKYHDHYKDPKVKYSTTVDGNVDNINNITPFSIIKDNYIDQNNTKRFIINQTEYDVRLNRTSIDCFEY